MTDVELRDKLLRIRDGCAIWAVEATEGRVGKGLLVALEATKRANEEIERLDNRKIGIERGVNILINGFDPKRLEFGSNTGPTQN
jgi:hypothetical protein